MTRREFIGMASVGVVAVVIAGRFAFFPGKQPEEAPGNFPVQHDDVQWKALLSPAAYDVLRQGATERPFSSKLLDEHRTGRFDCAGCNQHLFDSRTKYDSHTGWPSFWDVLPKAIAQQGDHTLGMSRTEVRCANCGGHLGHVFEDGPKPTGLRYCMNGVAMAFVPTAA